jgi:hypothetical protein
LGTGSDFSISTAALVFDLVFDIEFQVDILSFAVAFGLSSASFFSLGGCPKTPHSTSKCNELRSDFNWCFKPKTLSWTAIDCPFYLSNLLIGSLA